MEFAKVLAQLREELANLDAAIESLERLQRGGKRRGRPPAWLAAERGESTRKTRPGHGPSPTKTP